MVISNQRGEPRTPFNPMTTSDLPLFGDHTDPEAKLLNQWNQAKGKHPHLLPEMARIARELRSMGRERYSINGLFEILRWETRHTTGDHGLKMNNNHRAFAARDLMATYPDLEGFFQIRRQQPRGNNPDQIH